MKSNIYNTETLLNEVAISKWQPKFKFTDDLALVADKINQPHEDYPCLVDQTREVIELFAHSAPYRDLRDISWSSAQGIQKILWKHKEKELGGYIELGARKVMVTVGDFVPPIPFYVEDLIEGVFKRFHDQSFNWDDEQYTIDTLTQFFKEFETVHPFTDLNGRVGNIILNIASCHLTGKWIISCY